MPLLALPIRADTRRRTYLLQEPAVDEEIQLISDGDGLAVIGEPSAVERFLSAKGFASKPLDLTRVRSTLDTTAGVAKVGSTYTEHMGRWVKLTKDSAEQAKSIGLMTSKDGLSMGVVYAKGQAKGIKSIVQFEKVPGTLLSNVTNPAMLSGAAGLMAQLAMQQTIDGIVEYLETIDQKVDDLLRGQKDSVLADLIGVELVIDEAMTIREQVGRVSEVTWSKVDATSLTLARTQGYALRQLDALASKVERESDIGDLADKAKEIQSHFQEWLAVLALCFQLQDASAILELDRVLDASPEELDSHRLALRAARQNRLERISQSTTQLISCMRAAADRADAKVLIRPMSSRSVVQSVNDVVVGIGDFHQRLGIEDGRELSEARRWIDAAAEVRDKVLETGTDGVEAAKRMGGQGLARATGAFRSVDLDGDGIPDKSAARATVEGAGYAIKGAAAGAAGAVGGLFRRRRDEPGPGDSGTS